MCYNKKCQKPFGEHLKRVCSCSFSNDGIHKLILLLRESVYPYEYTDYLKKLNENDYKDNFYRHLNMEDITHSDYTHAKKVGKDFEIKNPGK